jgi:hypothetical protein
MVSGRTAPRRDRHVGRIWAGETSGAEAIAHTRGGEMRMPHTGGEGPNRVMNLLTPVRS